MTRSGSRAGRLAGRIRLAGQGGGREILDGQQNLVDLAEQLRLKPGQRRRQDPACGEFAGAGEDLARGAVEPDPAFAEQHNSGGTGGYRAHVVGDGEHREAGPVPDPVEQGEERPQVVSVLPGRGLVQYEDSGRADEERAEGQPLPAALAQLPRAGMFQPAETEELDRAGHVEHRFSGPGTEPEAELKLVEHGRGEQHLVRSL